MSLASAQVAAQESTSAAEDLDCAIWAAYMAGTHEDPEVVTAFGYVMSWFIGLYEGATGQKVDEPMIARSVQLSDADLEGVGKRCKPRMQEFGDRLMVLGEMLAAVGE